MVGEDSSVCSKETVPLTLESPRRTATVVRMGVSSAVVGGLKNRSVILTIDQGNEWKV